MNSPLQHMEWFEPVTAQVLLSAASGLSGAVLTYLGLRRKYNLSERAVYLEAVEHITGGLRLELERVNGERMVLLQQVRELEHQVRALRRHAARADAQKKRLRQRLKERRDG